jgi:hypothetical protein
MSRKLKLCGATTLAALMIVMTAAPAFAHEQRQVGAYQFTVGWEVEPTYTGVLNAVQLFIHDSKGNPVDDLGDPLTLAVTVSTGSQTSGPLDLEPSFDPDTGLGVHGEFDADVVPTTPGTYSFHFTGTINGQVINQTFTSSDSTFDNVQDPTAIEFPTKLPDTAALSTNLTRLNPRVNNAVSTANSAHSKANSASTLALLALVIGVVVGIGGIIVGVTGRRRQA